MSDTILLGVLRMPFELAMSTPIAQIQYHQRGVQAADEIEKLTRERDESKSKETDYREGFEEGWDAAHEGAAAVVEKLREALRWYADLSNYLPVERRNPGDPDLAVVVLDEPQILRDNGTLARAALEAKP